MLGFQGFKFRVLEGFVLKNSLFRRFDGLGFAISRFCHKIASCACL